jgi:hypothetical protein
MVRRLYLLIILVILLMPAAFLAGYAMGFERGKRAALEEEGLGNGQHPTTNVQ